MMTKRVFQHRGRQWEVEYQGYGVGVATGYVPKATHFAVLFRPIDDASAEPLKGMLRESDLSLLREEELRRELDRRLVLRSINQSNYTWRTPDGISSETTIPSDRVASVLEAMPRDVIRSVRPNKQGKPLYTTRQRYKSSTSFFERYLDVLDSSST